MTKHAGDTDTRELFSIMHIFSEHFYSTSQSPANSTGIFIITDFTYRPTGTNTLYSAIITPLFSSYRHFLQIYW